MAPSAAEPDDDPGPDAPSASAPPRLVRTGLGDPARVSAVDEAVLDAVVEGRAPTTLHLYRRDRPTVSLGRFSRVDEAVDRAWCEEEGVALVRRLSAGGAIYTDPGQVLFGLAGPELAGRPDEVLERACTALAGELADRFGVTAVFEPANDVHVDGRKVAGMAVALRRGVGLLHGALIVEAHPGEMARALRLGAAGDGETGDPEGAGDAAGDAAEATADGEADADPGRAVVGLSEAAGREVAVEDAEDAVAAALGTLIEGDWVPRDLSEAEQARARHLLDTRYGDPTWTLRR